MFSTHHKLVPTILKPFSPQVDNADFHVEKSVTASGTEAVIEVTFEPSHLGDSQTTLFLSSLQGGDYTIPLFGHCLPPHPQGPYTVKAGQMISLPFKNVFPQTMQFSYAISTPVFSVRAPETLKAKKTCNIQVIQIRRQSVMQYIVNIAIVFTDSLMSSKTHLPLFH